MGSLRKYLLNGAIISAVLSGFSALRAQRKAPADWRTGVTWVAWALMLIVAVGTVRIESSQSELPKKQRRRVAGGPKF